MTLTGPNLDVHRKPNNPNPIQVPLWDLIDLFYAHAAAGVAEAEAGAPEGVSTSSGVGPCGGSGGDGSQGGEVGKAGAETEAGAEAEAGAEEALLMYPLDAPSWLDLAEEMCTLLVARGRYATQGSNPRLAGRAPGRPCSATPTVEPLRGQRMTRRC